MPVNEPVRILFVDDVPSDTQLAVRLLEQSGVEFEWTRVDTPAALTAALTTHRPDLVVSDFHLPGFGDFETLAIVREQAPALPFIVLTGALSDEKVVDCLKAGAWDYVLKENPTRLGFAVREALAKKRALDEAGQAQRALLESERRYRTLADTGQALIWMSDADSQHDYFNQPWLDFTGRTFEEQQGEGWLTGVHPEDRSACRQAYQQAVPGRDGFTRIFRLLRHDGTYRSIKDLGTPRFDTQGRFLGYVGHGLDVTDLLHAEAERAVFETALANAQKLEAVGRLAGGVSHDFNNLLTGILGYCDLLLTAMPATAPYRADVLQIQSVAHRASTVTRQLLAFSRRQAMSPVALNLTNVAADLKKPLRTMLRSNIELAWDLAPAVKDIAGDPAQIEQAVYNLVTNASDAMPEGGRLTIRTAPVTLDDAFVAVHPGSRAGHYVSVSVADTGAGIDPQVLPMIFEPFFTTKGVGEGTGLGLAAVYGIVRQSDGYVTAESEPLRGTTITMYFPLLTGPIAEAPPAARPADEIAPAETVLFVEDDEGLRVVLRRVLEGRGYRVLEAVDGMDATTRFLGEVSQIDLLLTDLVMPGRNGAEVARLFREARPSLPVIFTSAYTDPAILKGIVLDDSTSTIGKPYLPSVLARQIREMLD